MEPLSLNLFAQRSRLSPLVRSSLFGNSLRRSHGCPRQFRPPRELRRSSRRILSNPSLATAVVAGLQKVQEDSIILETYPKWSEFASRVSGEWDGFGAEFSSRGDPIELPENVVPEAFREWGVQVFDWQTQCPTLADTAKPSLIYKLIKLLPTVGCEADAATRYSVEEKTVQESSAGKQTAFAYDQTGNYVSVWPIEERIDGKSFELEHCLVHPKNHEVRIRVIQRIRMEQTTLSIKKINVFSEQWYGPFRNGEQLGGCAIRESGFASTAAIEEAEVLGTWQGDYIAATFADPPENAVRELSGGRREKLVRGKEGLVTLPKQLWSSTGKKKDEESWVEVGWMTDHGQAITSRCVFSNDGKLKEIAVGHEAVTLDSYFTL